MIPTALLLLNLGVYLPSPQDKDGWGLRVHNLSVRGPYAQEYIGYVRFDITLVNFSKETRFHDPLVVARAMGDLQVRILQPDGRPVPTGIPGMTLGRDPFAQQIRLRPGEASSISYTFGNFRYITLAKPGRYRMEATLKVDGKTITSPPVWLEVVEGTVLVNYRVLLEGAQATNPPERQSRLFVQQVRVGDHTRLIYLRRLAELPGKCEMTVEGAFGSGRPLTITYKTSPTAAPTKLVVNSIDGSPWVEPPPEPPEDKSIPRPRLVKP